MLRTMIPHLHGWYQTLRAAFLASTFGIILAGRSVKSEYTGFAEPSLPNPLYSAGSPVNQYTSSGAIAFGATSPQTVTVNIPLIAGVQPQCRVGKWRLRVTGVDANTTMGIVVITVDDGTNKCVVDIFPAFGAAQKGNQLDYQGDIAPIGNNSETGGASDGMPTNIVNVNAIVAFATTTGSGNIIADICLEFFGGP